MSIHTDLLTASVKATLALIFAVCWAVVCFVSWSLTYRPGDTLAEYMEEYGEDEGLARWQRETIAGRIAKWRGRA